MNGYVSGHVKVHAMRDVPGNEVGGERSGSLFLSSSFEGDIFFVGGSTMLLL